MQSIAKLQVATGGRNIYKSNYKEWDARYLYRMIFVLNTRLITLILALLHRMDTNRIDKLKYIIRWNNKELIHTYLHESHTLYTENVASYILLTIPST